MTQTCIVCRSFDASVGVLCLACRERIWTPIQLLPQQIVTTNVKPLEDVLVDRWGRWHPLEPRTLVGRALDGPGISIIEASISRHHAHLTKDRDGWHIRDLGSVNGTYVNGQIVESGALATSDRIAIGSVAFYLVCDFTADTSNDLDPASITTNRMKTVDLDDVADEQVDDVFDQEVITDVGLPHIPMRIVLPAGGGGGLLHVGDLAVQLSVNQTRLVELLAQRMLSEQHQPDDVRGFVRSSELLGSLAWDSPHPDENHVKQLIRRTRRHLERNGVGDLIEARQRFGYRLRLVPK